MLSFATIAALALAALSVLLLIAALVAIVRRQIFRSGVSLVFGLTLLAVAVLTASVSLGTVGYRSLTHEEVAATVTTRPLAAGRFSATFVFPDGRTVQHELSGDELYIDAHILKWKPVANMLGLRTGYELDRVAGRYRALSDEQQKPRSVYSLSADKPVDMFTLRSRYPFLGFLVDAQYGSATFIPTANPQTLEVRVSTSGLLIRPVESSS